MQKWLKRHTAMKPLNEMHLALGEFLTAMGRVEFRMLLLMDIVNEAPLEHLFAEYSGQPFGEKIKLFKMWVDLDSVLDEQKKRLKQVYADLEALRLKRNFIVHGETWEGAFGGEPAKPYRVGLEKGNLDYLDEFERAEHGPNVFDVQQVREATKFAVRIHSELATMRNEIKATAVPYEGADEPEDMSKWPEPEN